MSLSNSHKPNSTALPLREFSKNKGKLIISQDFENQIRFLCKNINTVEWSGVLYHTSEGDFEKPSEFICRPEHILLMDKGTSGYTEYDFSSPLFMDGLHDKPELMDMTAGHIHSHHSMQSFFSGTDQDELAENALNYNYYLSLIVNNSGQYVARVAWPGEIEGRKISFVNKKGETVSFSTPLEKVIFYYEMDIVMEKENFQDSIVKRFTRKFKREFGKSIKDAFDVLDVLKESTEGYVEEVFVKQYDRVIKSKTFSNNTFNSTQHSFNNSQEYDFTFSKGKNKNKGKGYNKAFQPALFETSSDNTFSNVLAVKYIKTILLGAEFGVEVVDMAIDSYGFYDKPLYEMISEANGKLSTANFEKEIASVIDDEENFGRLCEKFEDIMDQDSVQDINIAEINQNAIKMLSDVPYRSFKISKIIKDKLSEWKWE